MVNENEEPLENNSEESESEEVKPENQVVPSYESMVIEEPERKIDLGKFQPAKTISEEEEEQGTLSDFKAALRSITPKFKNPRLNELLQPAMMSRVFPDNYTDKHFLLSAALIEEHEPTEDIDVVGIISQVQDALSIGYEGRHIVDVSELFGVTRDQDMDKLVKDLGLG